MRGFWFRPSLKKVSSACGRRNEAPRRTREKNTGTQDSLENTEPEKII